MRPVLDLKSPRIGAIMSRTKSLTLALKLGVESVGSCYLLVDFLLDRFDRFRVFFTDGITSFFIFYFILNTQYVH